MQEYLQIGVITKPHGVRGAVRVFPTTDDVKRFKAGQEYILQTRKGDIQVKVEKVQYIKQFAILKFEGIDTPEDAERYRECPLLVDREHAVKLKKDEYFISDLIGMEVISDENEKIGVISDVISTGANEVLVIEAYGGKVAGTILAKGHELLFPSIKECILKMDIDQGVVTAHIMPGLLD